MEAVNSETLQQSIAIEQQINTITLNESDCLAAINLSKNSWKLNSTADILQYENNKAAEPSIYNNKFNNANKKIYDEEDEEAECINNKYDSIKNKAIDNNGVKKERTNNILHKIDDKCDKIIEKINEENCLNHIRSQQINHNKNAQINNCENLIRNIGEPEPQLQPEPIVNEVEENIEETKVLESNLKIEQKEDKLVNNEENERKKENNIENRNLLNNVPTTSNAEKNEENKEIEEDEQAQDVPVELTTNNSAEVESETSTQPQTYKRSRCSSISSIASNYSTSSGNTPNLVIDHLVAAQKLSSKRKVSSWSSSSDTEEPAAKHAHLDSAISSSSASSSSDESESEICNAVVQQQSPLKIKIVQTPTPVDNKECHGSAVTENSVREASSALEAMEVQQNNFTDGYGTSMQSNTEIEQEEQQLQEKSLASPLKNAIDYVQNLNTQNQLEPSTITTTTTTTTTTLLENTLPMESIPAPVTPSAPAPVPAPAPAPVPATTKNRVYKCASCGTVHESWNFFMHIYEKHQRYICLYCMKLFTTAEKLSVHLEIKHDLEQDHFNSEEALRHYEHIECQGKYLMCCTCQHMFLDEQPFSNHDCNIYMQPCSLCGQMGRHSNNCKAHPDATKRNNKKVKTKPPPSSNKQQQQQATAVTDCDNGGGATIEGVYQQQQQHAFEQNNENSHSQQSASIAPTTIDYNVPETSLQQQQIEQPQQQQHQYQQQIEQHHIETNQHEYEEEEAAEEEEEEEMCEEEEEEELEIPPKLVVPKFKLRVPKEFQKSVDAVITSSEESENESESISTGSEEEEAEKEEQQEQQQQQQQIVPQESEEKKSIEKELEADLDVSDDTDSPTENQLTKSMDSNLENAEKMKQFKEQWEQRLKDSVNDMKLLNNEQAKEDRIDETTTTTTMNGTAQWTPTPPASPKSATTSSAASQQTTQQQNIITNETGSTEEHNNGTVNEEEQNSSKNEPLETDTTTTHTALADSELKQQEVLPVVSENIEEKLAAAEDVKLSPKIDIEAASEEDALPIHIRLERPLNEYENVVEFIRYCLNYSFPICLYCNHARRIAVNAQVLVTHMIENHRYIPAVNGISTAEDIKASSLMDKLKGILSELPELYINGNNFNSAEEGRVENERIYECFMCRFITKTHKELYLHNRKMHLRTAVLCFMCRAHFVSFTEVLCHICPGAPHKQQEIDIKYRCCLCNLSNIPSSFRLMVHLRKKHNSCDVCLEDCVDQNRLSSHVWKHKFRHYCYRCNISYRNKNDINNHLFWKHGTESTPCKRCLAKRWRHVYHFCSPSCSFICETCNECFSKAMYLQVHQRLHAGELKYACDSENCEEKFISRRLLLKHVQQVHKPPIEETVEPAIEKSTEEIANENSESKLSENEQKVAENSEHQVVGNETEQETAENSVEKQAAATEAEAAKKRKQVLTFEVLNLSESSDSSDSEASDTEQKTHKESLMNADETTTLPVLANADVVENTTIERNEKENNNIVIENEKEQNTEKVLAIWKNFLDAQAQKNTDDHLTPIEEEEKMLEECRSTRLHVAYSDHDYCLLYNPNEYKKKERHKEDKERKSSTPTKEQIQLTVSDNEAGADSSSDSESSDESGCSCGSNCSNCGSSSSNSDSDSSNSNSSDSDSSDDSNKSHKKSANKSKDSNRSPHKKRHRHDSVRAENHAEDKEKNEEVAVEIEPPRAPQIFESDLETSDTDSDEDFYAEHPQKEAHELLLKEREALLAQNNTTHSPINNHRSEEVYANGGIQNHENEHDDKKERKKLKKRKRDKRQQHLNNNNNSNNAVRQLQFEPQNVSLNNILHQGQYNPLYNSFSTTPVEPALNMDAYNSHMPFAAEQTVITGARSIISEGGGSSSEADGSLKRSKRMRRPNKFYGYTSDDETISGGQSLMIGARAFKPQPPPQLTWNKDDLPTPSKSILNQNKRATKAVPAQNLDEAFGEFAQLINQDNRRRTFGIAAGGKVSSDGAFYKRAAKKSRIKSRQLSSTEEEGGYTLPPIPRLKIKSSQIGLNLDRIKEKGAQSSTSTSASSSEDELELRQEVKTQAAKTLNVKPHLQFNALATPTAVLQAQQQQQQQQSQEQPVLPAAISTPIPKTTAFNHSIPPALLPNPDFTTLQYFKANNIRYPIRPPAGARQAREGESVYCYCRCPYDEVSEMIACDGANCVIEWFHFECVGIMMAPQGKWYCAECRPKYISNSLTNLVKPPF